MEEPGVAGLEQGAGVVSSSRPDGTFARSPICKGSCRGEAEGGGALEGLLELWPSCRPVASADAASSSARSAGVEEQVEVTIFLPSSRLKALFHVPVEGGSVQTEPVFPSEPSLLLAGALAPVGPLPRIRDQSNWERSVLRRDACPPSKPVRAAVLVGSCAC